MDEPEKTLGLKRQWNVIVGKQQYTAPRQALQETAKD